MRKTHTNKAVIGVLLIVALIIIGGFFLKWAFSTNLFIPATTSESHTLNLPSWIDSSISIVIGQNALSSTESFILAIAVFLILLVALADIINAFSSFNEATAWAIALGLAIIASVTRVVEMIITWFGITAGVGAIGIGLIIIWAIVIAVAMNFISGWSGLNEAWRERSDTEKVSKAVSKMRKGFGLLSGASDITENAQHE